MNNSPKSLTKELALLGVLATLWGSSYLFIKIALTSFPPATLIALRVTIAAFILLAYLQIKGIALPRDARTWRLLMVQSVLNSSLAWLVLAWGTQYIESDTFFVNVDTFYKNIASSRTPRDMLAR